MKDFFKLYLQVFLLQIRFPDNVTEETAVTSKKYFITYPISAYLVDKSSNL